MRSFRFYGVVRDLVPPRQPEAFAQQTVSPPQIYLPTENSGSLCPPLLDLIGKTLQEEEERKEQDALRAEGLSNLEEGATV